MPYISLTESQKTRANETNLVSFLQMKGEKLERAGGEYKIVYFDGSGKHDSITIRGPNWYDHKNQIGGKAIDFMKYFYGCDFVTAVRSLLGSECVLEKVQKQEIQREKKEFVLPEENSNMHRVYAYLIKQRYIDPQVLTFFAKKHDVFEDKNHHNAVFVGRDEEGVPRQAHLCSVNSFGKTFRITCEGSNTKYSFSHFGTSDKLFVFEAPIDMLSYISLHKDNWQENSYIAMNGVYDNAVINALEHHNNISHVVLCTDSDEGGIDAAERLYDILKEKGYKNVSREKSNYKDWNEDLKAVNGVSPLPAVRHKRKELYHNYLENMEYVTCKPEKLSSQIYATFKNGQYDYLSEYALSGAAYYSSSDKSQHSHKNVFCGLLKELSCNYRAYSDKGRKEAKWRNVKELVNEAMKDLKQSGRTNEQSQNTARILFDLCDCAVRLQVEEKMNFPQQVQECELSEEPVPCEQVL